MKISAFLLPLALGSAGLIRTGEDVLDAAFSSVTMYTMGYGEEPANWMVQLARWVAPVATLSGIALLFFTAARTVSAWMKYLSGNSVVVYGEDPLPQNLKRECELPVTVGMEKLLPAHRYVLLWNEEKNMEFYREYQEKLRGRLVYMRCDALQSQISAGAKLHLFSAEETGARLYWKQAGMYSLSCTRNHELNIVLIGFGKLGEELLTWGLQNNVFHPDQRIAYHIYGDAEHFLLLHHELENISDSVIQHDETWDHDLENLRTADRIIVCEQEQQVKTVQELVLAIPGKQLDILTEEPEILNMMEEKDRFSVFRWRSEAMKPQNIFDELTLERAKAINLRYAHLYDSVEETKENAEIEWEKLNCFTRYSNISAADYHEIRQQMMEQWENQALTPDRLELLSELEHIRWCRFHYLNNWRYGQLPDGGRKDGVRRIHRDLIPYAELDEATKEKDRENIRVMLKIR
ncbi:MAG: hypothetical protein K6C12_08225 [Oscillospiraceae bacterium]|nr:hypothetical protein [Oscillospiraceae bacterium]